MKSEIRRCSHLVKNRSIQLISCIAALALTACAPPTSNDSPPILLFNGTGTSPNGVKAVEAVLKVSHLKYATVNSQQLNGMSESQLMAYRSRWELHHHRQQPDARHNHEHSQRRARWFELFGNLCGRTSGRKCHLQQSESDVGRAV